jgi:bifunctional non-homologous end joining protein LigD
MLATLGARPPEGPGWAWELKWDGIRALGLVQDGALRLWTRNGNDVSARYPELAALPAALDGHDAFLDGEIVAFDERGRPSFGHLQRRMHVQAEPDIGRLAVEVPVVYVVFDLLWLDGHLTTGLRYEDRRRLLAPLVPDGAAWRVPAHELGDGHATIAVSHEFALEGVMAKRLDSFYEPGRRTPAWVKIKNHLSQELVIGGWVPGKGARATTFGALLLGYYDDGALRYAGKVGTGFDQEMLRDLGGRLRALKRDDPPFADAASIKERGVTWVEPELVAEIGFTEWTGAGRLRHPRFLGLRDDKAARDVVRER